MTDQAPWITIIGIGDDGLAGITPTASALVAGAEVLVGGERHQAMVPDFDGPRITWADGLPAAMEQMARYKGKRVVVLATGDPMCFGAGTNLQKRFSADEIFVLPVPGAFSLAAARMRWSLPDAVCLTIHGRPNAVLNRHLAPGARLLALSRDGDTPAKVAQQLTEQGYGPSRITVLEHMGGAQERRLDGIAESWSHPRTADLNTLAIDCRVAPGTRVLAAVPGLPDDAFEHDGQITKREVRAVTLSSLCPLPGQVLWDVGAGSGAVGIEWLRSVPAYRTATNDEARAFAIEADPERVARIVRNAATLGVPGLQVVPGEAPMAFAGLPRPDTVFVGGGIQTPGLLEAAWEFLSPGGRLVANAASLDGQARLTTFQEAFGGEMTRIAIERQSTIGRLRAMRPLMPVLQLVAIKP